MILPFQSDEQFLSDVTATVARRQGVSLWWVGQSGFLVHYDGVCIAIDPYLSDSLSQKYAGTNKPHVRMSARVVDPALLSMVGVVTSSHNHTDHLDAETIGPMHHINPALSVLCSAANVDFAQQRLGIVPTGLGIGIPYTYGPFVIHAVPAAHNHREQDNAGHERYIGVIVEVCGVTIYHSGDTVRYEGMVEILRKWKIDVALLPINGNDPARGVAGNLDGREAATLAKQVGMGMVVPCHYDMFAFNTVSTAYFVQSAGEIGQPYRVLQLGERLDLPGNSV